MTDNEPVFGIVFHSEFFERLGFVLFHDGDTLMFRVDALLTIVFHHRVTSVDRSKFDGGSAGGHLSRRCHLERMGNEKKEIKVQSDGMEKCTQPIGFSRPLPAGQRSS